MTTRFSLFRSRRRLIKNAGVAAAAALVPALPALSQSPDKVMPMADEDLSADDVLRLLDLTPDATCGFVRVTFVSRRTLPQESLPNPFAAQRPLGSALYFLVTPAARSGTWKSWSGSIPQLHLTCARSRPRCATCR